MIGQALGYREIERPALPLAQATLQFDDVLGCVIEIFSAIIVVAPLVVPIATAFDVHAVDYVLKPVEERRLGNWAVLRAILEPGRHELLLERAGRDPEGEGDVLYFATLSQGMDYIPAHCPSASSGVVEPRSSTWSAPSVVAWRSSQWRSADGAT